MRTTLKGRSAFGFSARFQQIAGGVEDATAFVDACRVLRIGPGGLGSVEVPGLGIFVAPNLTPDNDTGLGNWTKDQIATAIRTGVRLDGHVLAPIMPWRAYAGLTKIDAAAIVEYLRSLPLMTQGSGSVWTGRQTGHIPNDDIAARPCQTEQLIKTTAQLSWRARKSSGRTKTTPLAKKRCCTNRDALPYDFFG